MDLAHIINVCGENRTLPLKVWWGGTFQLFARDVFYRMGIEVEVDNIAPYPYEENMQDRDEVMTQSQFREYLLDGAFKNHDTSFRWSVEALIPKEGGGEYQREAIMGGLHMTRWRLRWRRTLCNVESAEKIVALDLVNDRERYISNQLKGIVYRCYFGEL